MSSNTIRAALREIANQLEEELAPLTTIYHDNANLRVDIGLDSPKGVTFDVYAPAYCEIFLPKTYHTFPIRFFVWEKNQLSLDQKIDTSGIQHGLFA